MIPILFLLFPGLFAVKPVWKTPVSEPNPNANVEVLKEHSNLAKRAQPNYYTRPEQVSIPDYRSPRQRVPPPSQTSQQLAPHQITSGGQFRPFAWVGPQPKTGTPQTSYYENAPNKGQFPNGLPPLPPNWRQYPVQMIWIPDSPGQQLPQGQYPYYPGPQGPQAPPVIPAGTYGLYGPTVSTEEPMKPSAYPESYTGTVAHSPAASPITTTIPYEGASTSSSTPYQPAVTGATGQGEDYTRVSDQNPSVSSAFPTDRFSSSISPSQGTTEEPSKEEEGSTYEPARGSSSQPTRDFTGQPSGGGFRSSVNPTIRPGPQEPSVGSYTPRVSLPYDADGTTEQSTTVPQSETSGGSTNLFQMTTNPFGETLGAKTVPPVFLGSEEDDAEQPEDISKVTEAPTPTPQEEEEEMVKNFFPRPVSSQAYQPPGHQPEHFSSHINVNFKKPKGKGGCVTPPCRGVDTDKISLYKPDNEGSGPTLVISNAAKDDASRAGYKPAPPPIVNPYVPPPPPPHPEEEYATPHIPPGQQPFPPFGSGSPTSPRALIPAHNFSPPSTTLQPEEEYHETTTDVTPTARTVSTRYTSPTTTTTPRPIESTTTEEDRPEYVPPAIVHMTASTPSGKNPPTYVPLHPETSPSETTTTPTTSGGKETETQTSVTITRRPEFPGIETTPPVGGNVPPDRGSTVPSSSLGSTSTTRAFVTQIFTDRERTDSGESATTSGKWIYTTSESTRTTEYVTPSTPSSEFPTLSTENFTPSTASEGVTAPTDTFEDVTSISTDRFRPSEFTTAPTPPPSITEATTTVVTASIPSVAGSPPGTLPSTNQPPRGNPYAPPEGAPRVPNRLIGKPRILCLEDGISFEVKTILPLNGEVFANDRKRVPECQKTFTEDGHPKLFLPFATCGVKNVGEQVDSRAQYHMQVVLVIDQGNGTNTLQSFMAQCVHQKVNYNKQVLPKRIEEALEELRLVPSKLEQKASMPNVQMQIVVDEGHHKLGAEVSAADIGMPLALKWSMIPESDAYGMHVRNCKVVDAVGKIDHTLIDEQGCSADLQIIDHPHYDTYHDTASAHMWAFKVPDMASLQIKCDILICSNIKSSVTNTTSCEDIPSPPFCADVVTSPPNSILSDASSFIKHRRASVTSEASDMSATQSVRTSICLSKTCRPDFSEEVRVCVNTQLATTSTGLSVAFLLFAISFQIIARTKRA
ncbi:unnamed protein product [Caenorhabditis sp. 36 PRJEB53466]|nr:unnamed protein product [Caenorhabditis sp. 36 PRJEB53466]